MYQQLEKATLILTPTVFFTNFHHQIDVPVFRKATLTSTQPFVTNVALIFSQNFTTRWMYQRLEKATLTSTQPFLLMLH